MENNEQFLSEDNLITLSDDEGNEAEFEFLDLIEYEGKEYVVLYPTEEESDEVVILQAEADPENEELEQYLSVEDEDTLQAVFQIFQKRFEEEYDTEE